MRIRDERARRRALRVPHLLLLLRPRPGQRLPSAAAAYEKREDGLRLCRLGAGALRARAGGARLLHLAAALLAHALVPDDRAAHLAEPAVHRGRLGAASAGIVLRPFHSLASVGMGRRRSGVGTHPVPLDVELHDDDGGEIVGGDERERGCAVCGGAGRRSRLGDGCMGE